MLETITMTSTPTDRSTVTTVPITVPSDHPGHLEILSPDALRFIGELHVRFDGRRADLIAARSRRDLRHGLTFRQDTADLRADPTWRVAGAAPGLERRRVEITGPVDRKTTINALNSGADVWLADFEDATSPTWHNVIDGQVNLRDAIRDRIDYTAPSGKSYHLVAGPRPTIVVRPRGWHLEESHVTIDGSPTSGSLVDFGLYFFHNAVHLTRSGVGPYFYLPKLETAEEAALWNDVFVYAQQRLGLPQGTIRATVLIETITAAFQMQEILHALREHVAGLNAGRWDYIFSVIKNFGADPAFVLPDRRHVSMTVPFMRAYTELLVQTCHARGAYAIGGMAAVIPQRDPAANAEALARVRADKERESADGFDGSWVAHPGLVGLCREVFDSALGERTNQLHRTRDDVAVTATDLLAVDQTPGMVTRAGVAANVDVAVHYLDAWLGGTGAVGLHGLMEDAATAEIARCQIWQWIRHSTPLQEGGVVSPDLVDALLDESLATLASERGDVHAARVRTLFDTVVDADPIAPFFTVHAYPMLDDTAIG
jgi:malate synthase